MIPNRYIIIFTNKSQYIVISRPFWFVGTRVNGAERNIHIIIKYLDASAVYRSVNVINSNSNRCYNDLLI